MFPVQLTLNEDSRGKFHIDEDGKELGEMIFSIGNGSLTVYHTGVIPEAEGKGIAKALLDEMVKYAREHQLQVIPLCPYVHLQFRRKAEHYADIWKS